MKNDFLRECMSEIGTIPIDDFTKGYCLRCVNQGCSRSASNNLLFVKRTTNWRETLFTNVQRADENDVKYDEIRTKNFLPMNSSLGNVMMDEPEPVAEQPHTEAAAVEDVQVPTSEPVETEAVVAPVVVREAKEAPVLPTTNPTSIPMVKNTSFNQGMMLGEPPKTDPVIPVGGTFILDDD